MIAKKVPDINDCEGTYTEVAGKYGLNIEELRSASLDFLQSEGYMDGHECNNLHEWLTYESKKDRDNTPWQKGDDIQD